MNQVLTCLQKNKQNIRIDALDRRRQEPVAIDNAIRAGYMNSISMHVNKALKSGASTEEIQKVVEYILGYGRLLKPISELLRALQFGEADKHGYISIVDDCRED